MSILHKAVELELKSLTDKGQFSGYGSVFNVVDKGGDIVAPGAFSESLGKWKKSGRTVPVLWQHQTDQPIGAWDNLKEDDHGLLGDASLWLDEAPYARLAHKGMQSKAITGLSIGYRVKRDSYDKKTGTVTLHELDLVEISVVTNPMNVEARVQAVKAMAPDDLKNAVTWLRKAIKLHEGHMNGSVPTTDATQKEMMEQMERALSYLTGGTGMGSMKLADIPTVREFEDFLREAGFSKSQAAAVANGGLVKLSRGEPASETSNGILAALRGFNLTPN